MPIYEYRCDSCGTELEKLQKISDPPLQECPECGKPALVKLISASSFRLKGSGWYETDFKSGKKKNGVGESTDSSTDSSGASAGSTEKTAAKTEGGTADSGTPAKAAAASKTSEGSGGKSGGKETGAAASGSKKASE